MSVHREPTYKLVELFGPPGGAPEDIYEIHSAIFTAEQNETAGAWKTTSDGNTWIRHDPGFPALAVQRIRAKSRRVGWVAASQGAVLGIGFKVRLYPDARSAMVAAEAYYSYFPSSAA